MSLYLSSGRLEEKRSKSASPLCCSCDYRSHCNTRAQQFQSRLAWPCFSELRLAWPRSINQLIAPAAVLNHDELKNKVYLTAKPNISMSFRGRLATILGMTLKPLGGLNYHKEPDFTANVIMYAPHQCDINAGFYTMYVYTDIIQYQAVGDSYVPLLRCVHITGKGNDAVIARYDNPHYASISKDHITSIVIELYQLLGYSISASPTSHCPFKFIALANLVV